MMTSVGFPDLAGSDWRRNLAGTACDRGGLEIWWFADPPLYDDQRSAETINVRLLSLREPLPGPKRVTRGRIWQKGDGY
jgi:hypothetical protein